MIYKEGTKSSKFNRSHEYMTSYNFSYCDKQHKSNKNEEFFLRLRIKSRVSNNIIKKTLIFNADLPKTSSEPIIHTYALPGKTLSKSKIEEKNDLCQFDRKMQVVLNRFENKNKPDKEMNMSRKGVIGCKRNSVLAMKLMRINSPLAFNYKIK
ncbi:hypothetical protein SteCoe_1909 [Stentor coeruleus]|uniref:Uncharacterized protein n=1 Tax=Stentor coeruleus TaxID=5963 RepID=A0A1R2D0Y8_9CILI|nr:hypothetical protein SteCoe_1909 [Stentor coeruleus]